MAARYWVGGSATWDGTAGSKWALTSGGAGGEAVPTSADNVFFDANSGAVTVTVATGNTGCANLDFTGFTGTFAGSASLSVYGSLTLGTGMTRSYTGNLTFAATATGKTITMNGKTLASSVTFDGVGGGWTLQDAFSVTTSAITVTTGDVDTNGQAITAGSINEGIGGSKSLSLGASLIALSGSIPINMTNDGLVLSAGTSVITLSGTAPRIILGGYTFYDITFSGITGTAQIFGVSASFTDTTDSLRNLTAVGGSSVLARLEILCNLSITSTLSLTGNSVANRLYFGTPNNRTGHSRTVSVSAVSFTNVDFIDIAATGATPWTGTSLGNCGGNTNITFDTPVTRYWVATSGGNWNDTSSWSTTSGGSSGASVPLPQDTAIFDASSITSGGRTITVNRQILCSTITATALANSPTLSFSSQAEVYGQVLFPASYSWSGSGLTFKSRTNVTFATNSVSIPGALSIYMPAASFTLTGDVSMSGALTIQYGTFNADQYDIAATSVVAAQGVGGSSPIASTTIMLGSGVWTLSGTQTAWSVPSVGGFVSIEPGTSTIKIVHSGASTRVFNGGNGHEYYALLFSGGGTECRITGSNSFASISTDTAPTTFTFQAGSTTTLRTQTLSVSGTAGNIVTLKSLTNGSPWYITTDAGSVSVDYVSVRDSVASENRFFAGANSTDVSGNTGWIFAAAPAAGYDSGFFAFMR